MNISETDNLLVFLNKQARMDNDNPFYRFSNNFAKFYNLVAVTEDAKEYRSNLVVKKVNGRNLEIYIRDEYGRNCYLNDLEIIDIISNKLDSRIQERLLELFSGVWGNEIELNNVEIIILSDMDEKSQYSFSIETIFDDALFEEFCDYRFIYNQFINHGRYKFSFEISFRDFYLILLLILYKEKTASIMTSKNIYRIENQAFLYWKIIEKVLEKEVIHNTEGIETIYAEFLKNPDERDTRLVMQIIKGLVESEEKLT